MRSRPAGVPGSRLPLVSPLSGALFPSGSPGPPLAVALLPAIALLSAVAVAVLPGRAAAVTDPGMKADPRLRLEIARIRDAARLEARGAGPGAGGAPRVREAPAPNAAPSTPPDLSRRASFLSSAPIARNRAGEPLVPLFLETALDRAALVALGAEPGTRAGGFWTARVPARSIPALLAHPGIRSLRGASRARLALDFSVPASRGNLVRTNPPPAFAGATGKGIVVGSVDTGLDTDHGDFRRADGRTRVLALWDQWAETGTPPEGFAYGARYDAEAIDANADTGQVDLIGHGTHTIGIAAGDGSATANGVPPFRYAGIAPEADIVAVNSPLEETMIADGVRFVFDEAERAGRPAVVNLSLGTQYGPHDGTSPLDRMMTALAGPGRIVVAAAGNEGRDSVHAEVRLSEGGTDSVTVHLPAYGLDPVFENYFDTDVWYDGGDEMRFTVVTPGGRRVGPIGIGIGDSTVPTPDGWLQFGHLPVDGQNEFLLRVRAGPDGAEPLPSPGTWTILVSASRVTASGEVDAWLAFASFADFVFPGFRRGVEHAEELLSPATSDSVIAVGAWATRRCWNLVGTGEEVCYGIPVTIGDIAFFSNHGPSRSGREKPELAAPGFGVVSALSEDMPEFVRDLLLVGRSTTFDGLHWIQAGTSMSSPHVAGAVALLLEREPLLGPGAATRILQTTAAQDAFTGTGYHPQWGFGKLDVARMLGVPVPGVIENLRADLDGLSVTLAWRFNGEPSVLGFHVYRATSREGPYERRNAARLERAEEGSFTDGGLLRGGVYFYLLGAVGTTGEATYGPVEVRVPVGGAVVFPPPSPNPFRLRTTIRLELPAAGAPTRYAVDVFRADGRRVRRIAEGTWTAAEIVDVAWDGTGEDGRREPSGIYFARLRAGELERVVRIAKVR